MGWGEGGGEAETLSERGRTGGGSLREERGRETERERERERETSYLVILRRQILQQIQMHSQQIIQATVRNSYSSVLTLSVHLPGISIPHYSDEVAWIS